jgi:serine/threonine protein kinase
MKSLAPNTLLQNRYLVVHLIGKGGMGDVYLAVDQRLGSAVALKRTFFSDDEMFRDAFEREAKTLARLRHPVLTKVSDHFAENDVQFLVMEHISGDDLAKRLEEAQKPFPLSWVLFWADQLLDALAYLHTHEPPIIHRDIKPQNLKLTDENSIILLDFGLSKNTGGDTRPVSSGGSTTGSVVGYTPHYAPMEQIRGTGTNPRSDIYSLSATLYQLLTNVVPFDALTRADAMLNEMDDPVIPISDINPEVSPAVSAVILKGMELSQDRRFSDAREMQKALREAFAQIQTSMAAQTIAFNLQNEPALQSGVLPDLPSPEKPAVLNIPPKKNRTPPSSNYNSAAQKEIPGSLKKQDQIEEPNFDATLRMDTSPGESFSKQSDVKTEVFLAGSAPLIPPAENDFSSFSKNNKTSAHKETFNEPENFSPTEDIGDNSFSEDENNYAPSAVPLFSADNQTDYISNPPGESAFFSSPKIQQEADAFETYTPASTYSREGFPDDEISREKNIRDKEFKSQSPAVAKKSSGKMAAIVGGIFALLVLVLGAAAGGWFVYNNYYSANATVKSSTPTPEPTVEFSPTPEPTVETVFETNTDSADNSNAMSNSNSEVVSSNSNGQSNLQSNNSTNRVIANSRAAQPAPQTVITPKPQTQVAVKNPPKTNPTPASKPSVKPAGKKPEGPVILQ